MAVAQRKSLIKEYSLRDTPDVQFCCVPCELWRQLVFLHEVQEKASTWHLRHKAFDVEVTDASPSCVKGSASAKSRKVDASFLAVSHLEDERQTGKNREIDVEESNEHSAAF
jgi:hypothetical protein